MSRLEKRILNKAKLGERRFAKDILCTVIHNKPGLPDVLEILIDYSLAPTGTFFMNDQALATDRGIVFAIPKDDYPLFEELAKKYKLPQEESDNEELTTDIVSRKSELYQPLVKFLSQNMVMARLQVSDMPDGKLPDFVNTYDILIETRDVGQTVDCKIVAKKSINGQKLSDIGG